MATAKRRGIQTDIYKVNEYINKVLESALSDSQAKLMTRINEAIVFDPLEILKRIQESESCIKEIDTKSQSVLKPNLFYKMEKNIHKNANTINDEKSKLIEKCDHMHNKMLFDCINESLDLIRPYGFYRQPMQWSGSTWVLFTEISE